MFESKLSAAGSGKRALVEVTPRAWVRVVRGAAEARTKDDAEGVPPTVLMLNADAEDGRHHDPGEPPYRRALPAALLSGVR